MALEQYLVDHNVYPPDALYHKPFLPRLVPLTTPVAYLSAVPEDVFATESAVHYPFYGDAYRIPLGTGPLVRPYPFDYVYRGVPGGTQAPPSDWYHISSSPWNIYWALRSAGPDQIPTWLGDSKARTYDPTNGTVSYGDIFFTGPGRGLDGPVR